MANEAKPRAELSREPTEPAGDRLMQSRTRFVALWGQMGANWGIPRTMAEVHATLFIIGEPMNADEIMEFLQISRGNVSMTLRKLLDWGIAQRVHRRGDRKDYYRAEQDVWKLFRTILRERKKREVDPVLRELRQCRSLTEHETAAESEPSAVAAHNTRLDNMLQFMELLDDITTRLTDDTGSGLQRAASTLSSV